MNRSPPELFPQRPIRSDFGRVPSYRLRRFMTICICLLLIGGILYRVLGGASSVPGEIPTIKAETGGWKQRPEQPGGIDIPHQDVEVYQALDAKDTTVKPPVEHLLPPPETPQASIPMTAPASTTNPHSATATAPQQENLVQQNQTAVETIAPAPTPVPASVVTPIEPQPAQPIVKPTPASAPAKSKPDVRGQVLKDTTTSRKTMRVQLAATQDEIAAGQMVKQLQSRYASVLGGAQLRLIRADLGDKGIYYRIQSQPMAGDRANDICTAIKKMKVGCILVHS